MRTVAGGNAAQPTGTLRDFTDKVKIEVANASDVLADLTSNAVSLEYESTADEIVDGAVVVFRWQSGASSYAPLMTANPPVDVGRRIVVSINAGSGSYKEVFRGRIDAVDWPDRYGDVTCKCRDQAGRAADTWIEAPIEYSTTSGVSLETVMQAVADDNLTTSYTLNFPVATGAVVQHTAGDPPYGPSDQSVLDALRALAESVGMMIRWRHFDASASDWKWTVFTPSRTKTVPDYTFAATDYWNVTQMGQAIDDIRNVVEVEFTQSGGSRGRVVVTDAVSTGGAMTAASTTLTTTGGNTFAATDVGKTIKVPGAGAAGATLTSTIATRVSATEVILAAAASTTVTGKEVLWGSIADYGRRYIKISEASDSPINRLALATSLANAALSDLKDPDALLEIECRYFWPGEVGVDLYRFSANNKHFSSAQDLAAMSFRHRIAVGERPTTWILTRGKPSGGVLMWKRRIGNTLPTTVTPDINVANFREVSRSQTTVTIGWDVSGDIDEIWVWYSTPAQPLASDPWASFTGAPTVRLTRSSTSYAVAIPDYGSVTYVQIIPIGVRANVVVRGNPGRMTIQGEQVRLVQSAEITATSATQCTVRVRVANPIAGGDITVTPTAVGCTISPTGAQTIATASQTSVLSTTGYVDYTVTRPAFQAGSGRVTFVASGTDRLQDTDSVDIPAQERDTQPVQVRITRVSESGSDIVVKVAAITPNAGATCTVTYDAGGLTVSPASGGTFTSTTSFGTTASINYTITKPAYTGTQRRVAFTVSASGFVDGTDSVDVPPMARDLTVNKLTASEISVTSLSAITADMGTLTAGKIAVGSIEINAATERILMGAATDPTTGTGVFIGKDGADYEFRAGNPAGAYMHWNGSALTIASPSLSGATITSLASGSNESLLGLSHDLVFSASDNDTVAWTAGTITFSNGASFSISSGNTGNIAALTYIYLDPATSSTVLQTTTTASTAVGHRKVLVATAKNVADTAKLAEFTVFGGAGGMSKTISTNMIAANAITANEITAGTITGAKIAATTITASNIAAGTITATEIAANTITAAKIAAGTITATELAAASVTASKISVSSLAAIQAELGSVTITDGTSIIAFKRSGAVTSASVFPVYIPSPDPAPFQGVVLRANEIGTANTADCSWIFSSNLGVGVLSVTGNIEVTGSITTAASVSGGAKFRLPHGTAPTSPVNGDMWTTSAGLYVRINGATVGPLT